MQCPKCNSYGPFDIKTPNGAPEYHGAKTSLVAPREVTRVEVLPHPDQKILRFDIFDNANGRDVGYTDLLYTRGKLVSLLNIRVDDSQ